MLAMIGALYATAASALPTIVTDKADYAPGETVQVTGTGFAPNSDFDIPIIRPDGSVVKGDGNFNLDGTYTCPGGATQCWDAVTTNAAGELSYAYILNGILGSYEIRVFEHSAANGSLDVHAADAWSLISTVPVATATFTDSAEQLDQWRTIGPNANSWHNGALNAQNSDYHECEVVPFQFTCPGKTAGDVDVFSICHDFLNGVVDGYDYIDAFNTDRAAIPTGGAISSTISINVDYGGGGSEISAINATLNSAVDQGGPGNCNADQREIIVNYTVIADGTVWFLWGGHLAQTGPVNGSHNWPGASLQMRTIPDKTIQIQHIEYCGDGSVNGDEECDDGNNDNGDGCDELCGLEGSDVCGDGVLSASEECDDGNTNNNDGCDENCELECGNGQLDGSEECDDGNTDNNDGCDESCERECGNGQLDGSEECDDGNTDNNDGCDENCENEQAPECGDGILNAGEQCDDGNNVDGDGCNANCRDETLHVALESFTAHVEPEGVRIRWTTRGELNNVGFRIQRAEDRFGRSKFAAELELITPVTIPARGNELHGADYEYFDSSAPGGRVLYFLEDVDTSGTVTRHGPVEVQVKRSGRLVPIGRNSRHVK